MSAWRSWVVALRWRAAADSAGLNASVRWLPTFRGDPAGPVLLHLTLGPGTSQEDVADRSDLLAASFKCARVEVLADRRRADRCTLVVHRTHVPAPVRYAADLIVAHRLLPRSHYEAIPLGVDAMGEVVTVPLFDRISGAASFLVGGVPGSGKTMGLRVMLAGLSPTTATIAVIDPTGGAEASLWSDRIGPSVLSAEPEPTMELLQSILDLIVRRGELIGAGAPPTLLSPLVLFVDELAELSAAGTPRQQDEARTALRRIVALGRKTNVAVVLATQRTTATSIDVTTRSIVGWRLALAHPDDVHGSEALLGPSRRYAANLSKFDVGAGYLTNGGLPTVLRVFELPSREVSALALSGIRTDIDTLHKWDEAARREFQR